MMYEYFMLLRTRPDDTRDWFQVPIICVVYVKKTKRGLLCYSGGKLYLRLDLFPIGADGFG